MTTKTSAREGRLLRNPRILFLAIATMFFVKSADAYPPRNGWGFGIADDSGADLMSSEYVRRLGARIFRFQVAYNAMSVTPQRERAAAKIDAARVAGVQSIMVTFRHGAHPNGSDDFGLPPADAWKTNVAQFVGTFGDRVDNWGVANEPNHGGNWLQHDPCRLAEYYRALADILATKGWAGRLVSPEWTDDPNLESYIADYKSCGGGFGSAVGWHPYKSVRYMDLTPADVLLRAVPSGLPIWITEVGALQVKGTEGPIADETQQATRVSWLLTALASYTDRIGRIYYYDIRQPAHDCENNTDGNCPANGSRWRQDSALEKRDGQPRQAWSVYCGANYTCSIPAVAADGTFVKTPDGTVYRIVGGLPVQLYTCAQQGYYGGCGPRNIYNMPAEWVAAWRDRQPRPRDGAFVWHPNGAVYRTVGGALVYLSTCAAQGYFPGCSNLIALDGLALGRLGEGQPNPRNGTLVRAPDGAVFRIECGDAAYVSDCANVGGCGGLVDLPGPAIHQLAAPAGCEDGNACTADRCTNLADCEHPMAAQCLAPIIALLGEEACGDGTRDAEEKCDDGNNTSGDGCSATCRSEAAPGGVVSIAGNVLSIRDPGIATGRRLKLTTTDARISVGAGIDPVARGAELHVFNGAGTGETLCIHLPAAGWRASGTGSSVSYKYRDATFAAGPCNVAALRRGRLQVSCRGSSMAPLVYSLDEPKQREVDVTLTSGDAGYCMSFGGRVIRDIGTVSGGAFYARDAPAPASCPVSTCP